MKLRPYTEQDEEEKWELHKKIVREVNSQDYSDKQIDAWLSYDPENAEPDDRPRWVVESEGELVGFGDYNPESGEITGIYVHPDYQGQGIATKLLDKVESHASENGLDKLWCHSTVTAKKFYQNKGYEILKPKMYETSGEELKVFKMKKAL